MIPTMRWVSRAQPVSVHDGDTLTVRYDRWFDQYQQPMALRLLDVWAPEVTGTERVAGEMARAYVESWISQALGPKWPLLVETFERRDKVLKTFDRFVARVWRVIDERELGPDIVAAGFATATRAVPALAPEEDETVVMTEEKPFPPTPPAPPPDSVPPPIEKPWPTPEPAPDPTPPYEPPVKE